MRVLLDACVLYPTIMRSAIIGIAKIGLFTPLWSDRILNEWHHAAMRFGAEQKQAAGVEIALLKSAWPQSLVETVHDDDNLWLPDENDIHVLAAAITGHADIILTLNNKDFPTRILSQHNIIRRDPDSFLLEFAHDNTRPVVAVLEQIRIAAEHHSGQPQKIRPLLKKARLPRLAKFSETHTHI